MTCGVDDGEVSAVVLRVFAGGLRDDHCEHEVPDGLFTKHQGGEHHEQQRMAILLSRSGTLSLTSCALSLF